MDIEGFTTELTKMLFSNGYECPRWIQSYTIPHLLNTMDGALI